MATCSKPKLRIQYIRDPSRRLMFQIRLLSVSDHTMYTRGCTLLISAYCRFNATNCKPHHKITCQRCPQTENELYILWYVFASLCSFHEGTTDDLYVPTKALTGNSDGPTCTETYLSHLFCVVFFPIVTTGIVTIFVTVIGFTIRRLI